MKKLFLIFFMLYLSTTTYAAEKEIKISVKGMVCSFCAQGITKKFKGEAAVSKVDVSLEKKIVAVSLKEGQDLPNETIEKLLKDAGYTIDKIERP